MYQKNKSFRKYKKPNKRIGIRTVRNRNVNKPLLAKQNKKMRLLRTCRPLTPKPKTSLARSF